MILKMWFHLFRLLAFHTLAARVAVAHVDARNVVLQFGQLFLMATQLLKSAQLASFLLPGRWLSRATALSVHVV